MPTDNSPLPVAVVTGTALPAAGAAGAAAAVPSPSPTATAPAPGAAPAARTPSSAAPPPSPPPQRPGTVRLPAAMLPRTDLTRAAVLATDPTVLGGIGEPPLLCGPQEDLVLMTLRRTWQSAVLIGPVTLRRDFAGFDLASLAAGTPLGDALVTTVTGSAPPGPAGVDRVTELAAAVGVLEEWTRLAR